MNVKLWSNQIKWPPQSILYHIAHPLIFCTQMSTLGYEWAFVRLLNRRLCHVSRLRHVPWKQPPIPFTRMKFTSFLCRVDCPFFLLWHLILSQHISVEWKTIELRLLFCRCHYDTVRSSRKLYYSPTECIMISSQFKLNSVDCLWFGKEWAVVIDHRWVKQQGWAQRVSFRIKALTLYVTLQHVKKPIV